MIVLLLPVRVYVCITKGILSFYGANLAWESCTNTSWPEVREDGKLRALSAAQFSLSVIITN